EVVVQVSSVRGTDDSPGVLCRVTDAGPGFREDRLAHVFERFESAGDHRGSGLGLSIARDLVRAHEGTIDASNDPATGGATVTFALPT
ncbi:MAG TPA: sensor histidine kinase, partial [Iamia sp.]